MRRSLLTLALLLPPPQTDNLSVFKQESKEEWEHLCNCGVLDMYLFFSPACLFLTALNTQQNCLIAPSPGIAVEAPCRAVRPGLAVCSVAAAGLGVQRALSAQRELPPHLGQPHMQPLLHRNTRRGKSYIRRAERHFVVGIISSWRGGVEGRRTPQMQWLLSEASPVLFFLQERRDFSFRKEEIHHSPLFFPFSVTQAFCHLKGWHVINNT